jgi:hypothetical protein
MFEYFQPILNQPMQTISHKTHPRISLSISRKFNEVAFMSQMIENLTRIHVEILAREQHPNLKEYDVLKVTILDAKPTEGKADLLSSYVGKQVNLTVRRELLDNTDIGDKLYCRASRTIEGAMCEPFPEIPNFRVW